MKKISVLIVDDDPSILKLLSYNVRKLGYNVVMARDGKEALKELAENDVAVILLDNQMPKMTGMQFLEEISKFESKPSTIMVTAQSNIETAVKAIKLGAYDYLVKPLDLNKLQIQIRNAVDTSKLRMTVSSLNEKVLKSSIFSEVLGNSSALDNIFKQVKKVSPTNANAMIIGESGTGKELIARAIHKGSKQNDKPFVPVNCAAISREISDSLIFGHKKGSFTGALEDKAGYFEQANNGTIFLDEIGDMNLEIQAKILRVLEERTVRRVGEKEERKLNFRVICATNKDLAEGVQNGSFREDLYYRLEEYPIYLPPLRKRKSDIPQLANHFLKNYCETSEIPLKHFSTESLQLLNDHDWPGNIRELRNVVRRSAIRSNGTQIQIIIFSKSSNLRKIGSENSIEDLITNRNGSIKTFEEIEQYAIMHAYDISDQNAAEAANLLQIGRATLYRKLKKYGLE